MLAVCAGCDYVHIDGTSVATAIKALYLCRDQLASDILTQDAIVKIVIEKSFFSWNSSEMSLEEAIKGAQLAANAFFHAPAFSVKQQKVVLLSGGTFSELPADLREYLDFDLDALNASDPIAYALGDVAGRSWALVHSGHAFFNYPVPSMIPAAHWSSVKPIDCADKKHWRHI